MTRHHLEVADDNGYEALLVCPEHRCGRRVIVNRDGSYIALHVGDPEALHDGTVGPLGIGVEVRA